MRLFQAEGEQIENVGRVEFCSSGQWYLVCYDNWDNNDATVVCRQLGYNVKCMYIHTVTISYCIATLAVI